VPPIREYDLNLAYPEDNVNGFCAFKSSSFVIEFEEIEAIILHKEICDIENMRHQNAMIVVSLMECGTKLLVEEPSVPHFYHTHTDQILDGITHTETRRAIQTAHSCKMNDISGDPERKMKNYILNFPPGISGKMGFMNPVSGRILVGSMNMSYRNAMDDKGNVITFTMATVTYAVAVDTDDQKIVRKNPAVGNEASNFFARMSSPHF
jgi:hypothetical protein